ncbi:hypothetical protein [Laspinema olomoucense]|uniref:hypothetical protein n=1 Tax=Laspinema olomoucense TaxID=3231600 RepID=UPI0021BB2533|nr:MULTISPECIES: hypothetical protein [unclassified Laspinema]MCT7971104.1 hypothetical protein [Laspinema sp. D3d]MCT7987631.1 hypothetical protein [Laspinema sp. D3a]
MSEFANILLVIVFGTASMWSISGQTDLKRELHLKNQRIQLLEARTEGLITGCLGGK